MFFLCLLLWLILFTQLNTEVIVAGIIVSGAVCWFACVHMHYKLANDYNLIRKLFLGLQYAFILVWETAKANIAVFRIVYSRKIEIEPRIIYFRTVLETNPTRVALANSITLMPGSVVIALEDGLFCVHCLDGKLVEGIEDSTPVRQLRKIEE